MTVEVDRQQNSMSRKRVWEVSRGDNSDRHGILANDFGPRVQIAGAFISWGALGILIYNVEPASPFIVGAFLLVLFVALCLTCTPIIYGLSSPSGDSSGSRDATLRRSMRQGVLIAGFMVASAVLLLIHALSTVTALLTFGVFLMLEVLLFMRNRR